MAYFFTNKINHIKGVKKGPPKGGGVLFKWTPPINLEKK